MAVSDHGRGADQVSLRLPDGMRDRIKRAADRNGRSANAEIVERLRASLEEPDENIRKVWLPAELWKRVEHEANEEGMDPNFVVLGHLERSFPDGQQEIDFATGKVVVAKRKPGPEAHYYPQMDDAQILNIISRYNLEIAEAVRVLETRQDDAQSEARRRQQED